MPWSLAVTFAVCGCLFETGSFHVAQAHLELAGQPRLAPTSSCLSLPRAGITGVGLGGDDLPIRTKGTAHGGNS